MNLTITEIEPVIKLPTLCLNMIVKNESKIITRLFDSVYKIIDCYCICDTGSTDNMKEVITEYFKKKNIPGKIVEEPFVNFAHNRNFALQSCSGMSDYVLLLDADMILQVKPHFHKSILLGYDSFSILQGTEEFYYHNTRIVRNNCLYSYVGVTHEYISTPPKNVSGNIEKNLLFIHDIGDGGAKQDKFERDIRLLKNGILEDPNNDRYHFYLANSYYDSGKYEDAIEIYKKRIKIGGWEQEVWYSYYRIGLSYQNMGKIEQAIFTWLEAYNFLPTRIENLYEIIKYYRIENKCKIAHSFYMIAKNALKTATNKDNYLFLNNDIYTYKLEYELSILSSYLGINNINDQVITIFNHSNDNNIINNTLSNMKFYKDMLKPLNVLNLSSTINHEIANKNRSFNSSSSSIISNENGYLMNVRYVNYIIDKEGYYHNCDDHIISINKWIEFSKDFKIINEKLLDSNFDNRRYIGIEDVRIYEHNSDILFIGVGLQKNENIGIFTGKYDRNENYIHPVEVKSGFSNVGCEKNWVFVTIENEIRVIYNWFPLHICKLDSTTNTLQSVKKIEKVPKIFKHMRGSTCGATFNDEIWFITHIVSYEKPRHYYHMFVVFDKSMNLLRYSSPFKFEGECIEYCIGLIVEEDRVIISYSTWDRTTKLAIYDKNYIDSIVKYN